MGFLMTAGIKLWLYMLLATLWTNGMSEISGRVGGDVFFQHFQRVLVIPDFFTIHTDGKNASELPDFLC